MKSTSFLRRALCLFLLLTMLLGYLPAGLLKAAAEEDTASTEGTVTGYTTSQASVATLGENESLIPTWQEGLARHYQVRSNPYYTFKESDTTYSYTYMAAMTTIGDRAYFIRTVEERNNAANTNALLATVDLTTNKINTVKTGSAVNTTLFGVAKSLTAVTVGSTDYLLVATGDTSAGIRLFAVTKNGSGTPTAVTLKASFTVKNSEGTVWGADRVEVLSVDGNNVQILIRTAWNFYTATIDVTASDSEVTISPAFRLDSAETKSLVKTIAGLPQSYASGLGGKPEENINKISILGMAYYMDHLYVSAHLSCNNVVLVYDNVSQLLNSGNSYAQANSDLCILASNYGYESYTLQDLAINKGVIYYCSRERWISSTSYRGDICHFVNSTSPRNDIIEGFRENDAYTLLGAADQKWVMINDNGTLKVVDSTTTTISNYASAFGLESNGQGYWYIRTLIRNGNGWPTSQRYITLTDTDYDASGNKTVTLEEKSADKEAYQLWSIRYTEMTQATDANGNPYKKLAIQSKVNGMYLNLIDVGSEHIVVGTTAGKTYVLRLDFRSSADLQELENLLFDYDFYKAAYSEAANMTKAEAQAHYKNTGKAKGYLPSPYFDPEYYRSHNSDLQNFTYEQAYNHFINYGFWEGRQGSLFFSITDYISRDLNYDVRDAYYPSKIHLLKHYINSGLNESAHRSQRAGSDEFDLKEFMEEFGITATTTNGRATLRDYVSNLIRMYRSTGTELEGYLFDADVYLANNRELTATKLRNAGFGTADSTHTELLTLHWNHSGYKEGRTGSLYYSAPYYIDRNPDLDLAFANAYEHFQTTGIANGLIASEYVAMGMDPEIRCRHYQTATALLPSCTDVCSRVEFCAACHFVVHKEESPALSHEDEDGNSYCDTCGNVITSDLLAQNALLQLPIPVPTNELLTDVTGFVKDSSVKPDGLYYMVQRDSDGVYRIFNPLIQSKIGTIAATQVFDIDGKLLGTDPGMAVEISYSSDQTEDTNHYVIKLEEDYYLTFKREEIKEGDTATTVGYNQIYRQKAPTNIAVTTRSVIIPTDITKAISTVDFSRKINGIYTYLCLEQQGGMEFFEWSYSNILNGATRTYELEDSFLLYRVLTDRIHTEALYAALQQAVDFVPNSTYYDGSVYMEFLSIVENAKALYEQYNGVPLTGDSLSNQDSIQDQFHEMERQLLDTMSILTINLQGNSVKYFSSNMYNWNEDEMNTLTAQLEGAQGSGFYFENANNKTVPGAPFSDYDSVTTEIVNGRSTYAQMYSIYSGIAAPDLKEATNPPFHNDNVVAADYWSTTPIENAKEVFTDVRVPFIYGEDGYYTLNSDTNGVFFDGTPASGSTLAILDKPMTYMWSGGMKYGIASPSYYINNLYSYTPSTGYVNAFQPFALASAYTGQGYLASASNFAASTPVDAYLMEGVAWKSGQTPTVDNYGRGTPTWGFGMQLTVDFLMTEDGYLGGDSDKPITFSFSGDDDVWVFIDGKLVMEIGGSHDAIQGEINFVTGDVIVSSEKYGRIRDKNENGYGRNGDSKNPSNSIGTIESNKMYQKNIYTEVFEESLAEFSASGEHTLSVYYMDRGKGRTNCAIKFNLPQSDALVVEKEIPPYYGNADGTLTDRAISDDTMAYLNELDFGFTLTNDGAYASLREYNLYDGDNLLIGTGMTDRLGHFTLKNGQRAEFINLQFNGQTYRVQEDPLNSRWATSQWSGTANGTVLDDTVGVSSPTASVTGDQYGSEVISFLCTNTYVYDPLLHADTQSYVMDYGKPMELDIIDNAVFDTIPEFVSNMGKVVSFEITGGDSCGTVTLKDDRTLLFTPVKMLDEEVTLTCTVDLWLDDGTYRQGTIPVSILPATIMLYESDFLSDTARSLQLTVCKPKNDSYNWTTKTADQGYDDLQDNGVVGDEVYLPVVDKEQIPSNAFFADFDREGYSQRYSTNPIYKGYDYDTTDPWTTVSNVMGSPEGCGFDERTPPQIDTATGTLTVNVGDSYYIDQGNNFGYGPHLRTYDSVKGTYHTVHLDPEKQNYVQLRFKLVDCKPVEGENFKVIFVYNRYKNNSTSYVTGAATQVLADYDYDGETYVTVRMPIIADGSNSSAEKWYEADYISGLGFRFKGIVNSVENQFGKVVIDYIYVGPEHGWAESVNSEYLYFGFDNSPSDQLRYSSSQYGRNFDQESDGGWATANNGETTEFSIDNTAGTITLSVSEEGGTDGKFGPSLMTTALPGTYPVNSNAPVSGASPLSFSGRNADFVQIRFKIENCEWSTDTTKKLLFLYTCKTGETVEYSYNNSTSYSVLTGEYQTIRIPISTGDSLRTADELLALGFRFRGIKSKAGMNGTVTIDEIFIGSREAYDRLEKGADFLFFDFTDTDMDKTRYSNSVYGTNGANYGLSSNWSCDYNTGDSEITGYDAEAGTITFKDLDDPNVCDWNYIHTGANFWDETLCFTPGDNDVLMLRMKIEGGKTVSEELPDTVGITMEHNLNTVVTVFGSRNFPAAEYMDGKYHVFTIPLNTAEYQNWETLTSVRPVIHYTQGCTFTLDWIYVGPLVEAVPSAQSLYIGFDDTEADRSRYDSDTYGYINTDNESTVQWAVNPDKVESIAVDNLTGTATLTAVPKGQRTVYDEEGNFIWPDVYAETGINGSFHTDYLDYKPQNAEIFQIRFKMQNVARAKNAAGNTISAYVKLFWLEGGTSGSEETSLACDSLSISEAQLTSDTWITLTGRIPEEYRNCSNIIGIRPYFGGIESKSETELGKVIIDYVYVGPDDRPDQVYGYDSHYNNDTTLSDGSSMFVEGAGVKLPDRFDENGNIIWTYDGSYTEASFTFKGTGFDIISRTGAKQATIRVEVADSTGTALKTLTVNNKGELELYQIPVVSVQGLAYDEYTVTLWVNQAVDSSYDFLKRGGEFYFDAIRIYDPAQVDNKVVYKSDREAFNYIKEIRNILLSKDFFESMTDTAEGAVFVDVNSANVDPETGSVLDGGFGSYITADVQTYNKIGPKNEVYLAPGQAVAFNLQVSTVQPISSLDIGAKIIAGSTGNLEIGILAKDADGNFTISTQKAVTITSSTAQYWEIPMDGVQVKSNGVYQPMYLIFYNTAPEPTDTSASAIAQKVVSLTDVKVAYKGNPGDADLPQDSIGDTEVQKRSTVAAEADPVQFLVDANTLPATKHFVKAVNETPILDAEAQILHSLNLASDIAINYIVPKSELQAYSSFRLECRIPLYEGNSYAGEKSVTLSPVEKGDYWYFTLDGLTAVQMNDTIQARLVMTDGARSYYSETDAYSIARYASAQLNKLNASPALKSLCANLLRYGSAAQSYKEYRTDFLADRDLTAEQTALLTDLNTVTFGNNNSLTDKCSDPKVSWAGKALLLDSKVSVRYVFDLTDSALSPEDLTLRLTYVDQNGAEKEVLLARCEAYGNTANRYAFVFEELLASELRTVLYATVYCGSTPVSHTLCYSVDTYCSNKTGTLGTLCRALLAYSDYAKAFFGG